MKLLKPLLVLTTCGLLGGSFAGCAWSIGDGGKEHSTTKPPTKGQELVDLKRAVDQGAITPEEYEAQKKKILAQ